MKVKNFCIYELIDRLFWIALALFPLISYLIYVHQTNLPSIHTFERWCSNFLGFEMNVNGTFYSAFIKIFENGFGFFDCFTNMKGLAVYITYLFHLEFIHVILDIMLFLPRWCHSFMRRYDYGKDKN